MKNNFLVVIGMILIVAASCKSKAQKDAEKYQNEINKMMEENSPAKTADNQNASSVPTEMKNILGEWTLDRTLRDDNGNHIIDGDEEKTAIINPGGYMRLNADGTCKFESVMDGTYEIITEADGRKRLAIKDLAGTKYPMSQFIVSVTDKELVINNIAGGSGFDVYKRP